MAEGSTPSNARSRAHSRYWAPNANPFSSPCASAQVRSTSPSRCHATLKTCPRVITRSSRNGGTVLRSTRSVNHHTESRAVSGTKALDLPQGGLHGFRRGCNRRWELAGINPAVIRQQMGHSSHRRTALYSGEIPLDQVRAAFSSKLLEKMENEVAA